MTYEEENKLLMNFLRIVDEQNYNSEEGKAQLKTIIDTLKNEYPNNLDIYHKIVNQYYDVYGSYDITRAKLIFRDILQITSKTADDELLISQCPPPTIDDTINDWWDKICSYCD